MGYNAVTDPSVVKWLNALSCGGRQPVSECRITAACWRWSHIVVSRGGRLYRHTHWGGGLQSFINRRHYCLSFLSSGAGREHDNLLENIQKGNHILEVNILAELF